MRAACVCRSPALPSAARGHVPPRSRQTSSSARPASSTCNHFILSRSPEPVDDAPLLPDAKPFRLAVKDNITAAGFPTQCASRILDGFAPKHEATIVRQLRARGARVVGKTNMDEFGMGSHSFNSVHGAVRSPLTLEPGQPPLSAGGSSGGSAVAVVLDDADVALGTDTGGSVRLPASYTGIVGYRPSYGMLSRFGVVPYANSLDTVGMMAREVRPILDLIAGRDAIPALDQEHDSLDPTSLSAASRLRCARACPPKLADNSELTVGIPHDYNIQELDPIIRETWAQAGATLQKAGIRVVPVSLPTTREALCAYYVIAPAEASSNLAKYDGVRYGTRASGGDATGDTLYSETRGSAFGDEVQCRILLGTYSLSAAGRNNYFLQAQRVRRLVRRDFNRVFGRANPLCETSQYDLCDMGKATEIENRRGPAQVDFLLTPTSPHFPIPLQDVQDSSNVKSYVNDVFTVPASLAGLPAVSLPAQAVGSRLPVGLQLVGQFWDDRRLLALAERLKPLLGWEWESAVKQGLIDASLMRRWNADAQG